MPTLKKLTPLIVLAIFVIGGYFIKIGMDNAVDMSKPKKVKVEEESKTNQSSPK